MKHIIAALVLLMICPLHQSGAQYRKNIDRYYFNSHAATRAGHGGDTDSAIYYCRMAIKSDPGNNKLYNYLGNLLIRKGAWQEAIDTFRQDILMGNIPNRFEYIFQSYDAIKHRPEVRAFQQELPALIKSYYERHYDILFGKMIYEMLGRDQAFRKIDSEMFPGDSVRRRAGWDIQAKLDTAVNLPQILSYLRANGFPRYSAMDNELSRTFAVIIHHLLCYNAGDPKVDELHTLVKAAVYGGKYSPYAYMTALDWHYVNRTGKQLYGTYIGSPDGNRFIFDPPIDSIGTVDIRRAAWKQGRLSDIPLSDWRRPEMPEGYRP